MATGINPNHPTTRQFAEATDDLWMKLFIILMMKHGETDVSIGDDDTAKLLATDRVLAIEPGRNGDGRTYFTLVSPEEAARLAKREGGLPT